MQVLQLLFGRHVAHALSAVARLGVADHLNQTAVSIEQLAREVGAHASSLYRVMRLLASFGVFEEYPGKRFAASALSETLRSDRPASLRYFATMQGDFWSARAMEKLPDTIRTGVDGISTAFGRNVFDLMTDYPQEANTFQQAMTSFSTMAGAAVVDAYDFSGIERLADIGGGYGTLLSAVLNANPQLHGVLYDLPEVVAAPGVQHQVGVLGSRVHVESGSFFEYVPGDCDAYILKHIIHDWDDERARIILDLIRHRLPENGRVLLCELVVPEGSGVHLSKFLDLEMLAHCVGGKERTEREFQDLLASAGLRLTGVTATASPFCLIEARRDV